jgi:hypothetical protein
MTGDARFCPQCGTQRAGFFRFCWKCGFDYDEFLPPESRRVADPKQAAPTKSTLARPGILRPKVPAAPTGTARGSADSGGATPDHAARCEAASRGPGPAPCPGPVDDARTRRRRRDGPGDRSRWTRATQTGDLAATGRHPRRSTRTGGAGPDARHHRND